MERDRADKIVEEQIVDAIVRKGEREAKEELTQIGSADELRRILVNAEDKHRRSRPTRASSRGLIWLVSTVAVAAAVLIVGFLPRYSTDNLYARWSQVPTHEINLDSMAQEMYPTQEEMYGSSKVQYNKGSVEISELPFYQAKVLAWAGDTDEAIAIFSQLAADPDSAFSEDAAWQLALTYLKAGEREKATAILDNIIQGDSLYKNEARQLLKDVERKWLF